MRARSLSSPLQHEVRLAQVERADVADRQQRVALGCLGVGEDARVQVEVVVGLGLVDVARAAARDRVELDQLEADARCERLRRRVELLRRQRREAALVVRDALHSLDGAHAASSASLVGSSPGRYGFGNEPGPYGSRSASYPCTSFDERVLALHLAHEPLSVLRPRELVQRTRLADVGRHMRREREPGLVVRDQLHGELHLLHARDDALGLRDELGLAEPPRRLRRADEPLRVLRAHVAVDAFLDRLGAELRDRLARVDALRAALGAEVAARAFPDAVLLAVLLEPLDLRAVARVADEAHPLRERLRAEKIGIRLHRIALGDAAAAVDAERLLVDGVHAVLRDLVLLAVGRHVVAGLQVRLHRLELLPEGIHVDDEVLDDRQVAHRGDRRDLARLRDVVHAHLAGEHGSAVHAHAAGAADHHPAALPVRERAVDLVLDDVEAVEERRLLGSVDLVLLQGAVAARGVVPPDLEGNLHSLSLPVQESLTCFRHRPATQAAR